MYAASAAFSFGVSCPVLLAVAPDLADLVVIPRVVVVAFAVLAINFCVGLSAAVNRSSSRRTEVAGVHVAVGATAASLAASNLLCKGVQAGITVTHRDGARWFFSDGSTFREAYGQQAEGHDRDVRRRQPAPDVLRHISGHCAAYMSSEFLQVHWDWGYGCGGGSSGFKCSLNRGGIRDVDGINIRIALQSSMIYATGLLAFYKQLFYNPPAIPEVDLPRTTLLILGKKEGSIWRLLPWLWSVPSESIDQAKDADESRQKPQGRVSKKLPSEKGRNFSTDNNFASWADATVSRATLHRTATLKHRVEQTAVGVVPVMKGPVQLSPHQLAPSPWPSQSHTSDDQSLADASPRHASQRPIEPDQRQPRRHDKSNL
ncbi:uncharacterized protein LY79DRAFT_583603 [Colletotrichum navitas]|uniref:Uncharacterized protein n=1 Tax=Colletotrichum navitas TaxID=681940 RepID=A0AAD8PPT5_9PEZI|nr:uncharacterized protein LY79DRAFT_583603 [Colletotrichum navitas]KAK1573473.1 hypothetical protein LY79DRAFT_583603 [Colletotrichum navitas]